VTSERFHLEPPPEPLSDPSGPDASLGEAAVSGSLWTLAQVVVVKLASLVGTLALMHLLSPEDFGVATLAYSVQTMVVLLLPFTLGDVLLARPAELARVSGTAHRLGLATCVFFTLATLVAGPIAAGWYHIPALTLGCALASLRPLAEWTMMLPLARLRTQLRFRTISAIDMICMIGSTVTGVIMAWLHAGFASVLLPSIAFTSVRAWFYRRAAPAPASPRWIRDQARPMFHDFVLSGLGQYVHGGLIALTPLVLGAFTGKREVGWYTMAFALSAQVNTLAGFSMGLVLQPIFAQMAHDTARQSAAFLRACRVIATLAMPICLLQLMLAPAAFRVFLPGKWTGAIVLTQILSIGQAFFFCINPAMGLLKAQGRFAAFMIWQTVQLVVVGGFMVAAGVLWRGAPLVPIVLIGGLYHAVSGPIGVWICVRGRGASVATGLDIFVRPLVITLASVIPVGLALAHVIPQTRWGDLVLMVSLPLASLPIFVFMVRRFDASAAQDCGRLIAGGIRRLRRSPAAVSAAEPIG
jgi:O-antigen/teichoic acid export membrane protein